MIRCNECIWYSSPLKAEEFERTSIDTNLCNERPKLLRKLPSKIQFSHFPFAFLCCRHIISFGNWCEWNANEWMHESSNGDEKKSQKIEMCADDWMRKCTSFVRGRNEQCEKKQANEWTMSMNASERESSNRKKYHCVAANRSTFDSIIISKITLVKSNFSIEKVHNSLVVFRCCCCSSSLFRICVNTFVRQVVIQLAYFIRISNFCRPTISWWWKSNGKQNLYAHGVFGEMGKRCRFCTKYTYICQSDEKDR